jgi:hypothetical protein
VRRLILLSPPACAQMPESHCPALLMRIAGARRATESGTVRTCYNLVPLTLKTLDARCGLLIRAPSLVAWNSYLTIRVCVILSRGPAIPSRYRDEQVSYRCAGILNPVR